MKKILSLILVFTLFAFSKMPSLGLIFDDVAYMNTPKTASLTTKDANIPSSASIKAYAPRVGDQGQTGTCTAWATAYGARTILESVVYNRHNLYKTTQNVFSPYYIYNQIRLEQGCKRGTIIRDALKLMQEEGVVKFSQFGEICSKQIAYKDRELASAYKIQGYKRLSNLNSTNKIFPVKKSISEKNPVVIGMKVPKSFMMSWGKESWKPKANESKYNAVGGHAMVVVGYDDYRDGGSFEIMNSWGQKWGKNGFIWIRYRDFYHFVRNAYEMIPIVLPKTKITIAGELKFVDSNGNAMSASYDPQRGIYVMNRAYYSGTRYKFFMSNKEPVYLYAFNMDSHLKTTTFFPLKNVSPYQGYLNSTVAYPSETSSARLDNTTGKEYFVVFYSKFPLDIESIKEQIKREQGTMKQRVDTVLGARVVKKSHIFNRNKIAFNHQNIIDKVSKKESIVAVIVEIDHR